MGEIKTVKLKYNLRIGCKERALISLIFLRMDKISSGNLLGLHYKNAVPVFRWGIGFHALASFYENE